jgi:hypothetical protein
MPGHGLFSFAINSDTIMKSTLRSIGACSEKAPTIKSGNGSRAKEGSLWKQVGWKRLVWRNAPTILGMYRRKVTER